MLQSKVDGVLILEMASSRVRQRDTLLPSMKDSFFAMFVLRLTRG